MSGGSLLPKDKGFFNRTVLFNALLLVILAFFVFQMARISMAYVPYNTDVGFLRIKQDYIDIDVWRTAFFVHIYMSIWVLLAGFTQFSKSLRSKHRSLHRTFGYIYAMDIVLITGPAGFIMGIYANGGITSKISFVVLACLWIYFTAIAVGKARSGDYLAHRDFMIRSYALTLSAVTLRAWKWGINNSFDFPPMDVYRAVAWLGWVPNLAFAEFLIWRLRNRRAMAKASTSAESLILSHE
ncbi:MAG TPA: DUF2306 domain-containing protein [Pyrinomonadaceae bacterium]|jgi:uncharacterized membrane protein